MGIFVGDFCAPLSPTSFLIFVYSAVFASDKGLNFLKSSAVNSRTSPSLSIKDFLLILFYLSILQEMSRSMGRR